MRDFIAHAEGKVLGIDLGDRKSEYVLIDEQGEEFESGKIATDPSRMRLLLETTERCRVVMEVGSQSRWVSHLGERLGHEVLVANARRVRLIYSDENKTDRWDCRKLARLGRVDATLLYPIRHRGMEVQQDLSLLRSREALVKVRTGLINHVRGQVKAWGKSLEKCSTASFPRQVSESIPEELSESLGPILEMIESLTLEIRQYEKKIEQRSEDYPEIERLRQIDGVGLISSATYVWTLEDPHRFRNSRQVGAYLGLIPRRDQSGEVDRRLGITKAGDETLRSLMVQCAHYILGPFGQDCDLRRFGEHLMEGGGRSAKKRAVVAVARKLSGLMHHLWVSEVDYDPDYQVKRRVA